VLSPDLRERISVTSKTPVPETTSVREAHQFDQASLEKYLKVHLPEADGPLEILQFEGGQSNPTYLLEFPGRRYVLRKKPPGELLPSAHQIEREYQVMSALQESDVPVPRVYLLCEDQSVIGTAFFVMEYIEGRVFRDPTLPSMQASERGEIYDALVKTLASLHKVDWKAADLTDYGRKESYAARQVSRWSKQYQASKTQTIVAMDRLMDWLPRHIPEGDAAGEDTAIVHGDYRLENTIFHPSEPRVLAVLDWELSTLGNPLADVAYNCLLYYMPRSDTSFNGFKDLDLQSLGIPDIHEYTKSYCQYTGRDGIPNLHFFVVFALFRSAAIAQGIMHRAMQGNASSTRAKEAGQFAGSLAELAWGLAQEH
jgi:aminoglycoside phosphotransferase (APT) family kinase protein